MKILVLNRSINDYAKRRFAQESGKSGATIDIFNYSHLQITIKDKGLSVVADTGEDLSVYDGLILRSPGLTNRYVWQERIIVDWMIKRGKKVLNQESLTSFPGEFDKLLQNYIFQEKGVPFVETVNYGYPGFFEKEPQYPFIVKRAMGSLGRDFKLIRNRADLDAFLAIYTPYQFIAQPYLPTMTDYRIIVLNGEVLGGMKRSSSVEGNPTNAAAGGSVEKIDVTEEMHQLALKAAKALKCEFCGVDIMYGADNDPHILEINRYSVFKEFEHVTGVNVTGKIIEYLVNK